MHKKRMAHISHSERSSQHRPTNKTKIIWGVLMAALAAAMMLGNGDGLSILQTLSIVAAFPFAFIMVIAMAALVKALKKERDD